jgi:hypothetical protein
MADEQVDEVGDDFPQFDAPMGLTEPIGGADQEEEGGRDQEVPISGATPTPQGSTAEGA